MSGPRLYAVEVALREQGSTHALLSLVSVLHRRAAEVGQASLSPASQGRRIFSATFTATDRQATTVRASLDNLIDVFEVVLGEATRHPASALCPPDGDRRGPPKDPPATPSPRSPAWQSHCPESPDTKAHRPEDNS